MLHCVTVLPQKQNIQARTGTNLLPPQLLDKITAVGNAAGSGGCRICSTCAFPESCRFPEKAYGSMEGFGLFVTQVCRDNGLSYYHGEKTITYTACILF